MDSIQQNQPTWVESSSETASPVLSGAHFNPVNSIEAQYRTTYTLFLKLEDLLLLF